MFARVRLRPTIALSLIVLVLFPVICNFALSRPLPLDQLHQLWDSHMFNGTSEIYSDGDRTIYHAEDSYQWANGFLSLASLTKEGIAVGDLRETSMLGWLRRGGWILEGGLLAKIESEESNLELYGKRVVRAEPVSILNLHGDKNREHSVEFFLLRRKKQDSKATLLKKWIFSGEEILLDAAIPLGDVKGILRNYIERKSVTLAIVGLNRPFEERVDISQ
jgi:hypothetical protein